MMCFSPEVTRKALTVCRKKIICNARLRTTIFETGVRILGRTSKNTIFRDFRCERSGDDQKQNDGNLTKVIKYVLTEKNFRLKHAL